jgi:hypothetical protein
MMPPNPYMASAVNRSLQAWYDEIKNYDSMKEESSVGVVGHFTALIWKDFRNVGLGATRKHNGNIYIVAQFTPLPVIESNAISSTQIE